MASETQLSEIVVSIDVQTAIPASDAVSTRVSFDIIFNKATKIIAESPATDPAASPNSAAGAPAATAPASSSPPASSSKVVNITETLRSELDAAFKGSVTLQDVANPSIVQVNFIGFDGRTLVAKSFKTSEVHDRELHIALTGEDIKSLTSPIPQPDKVPPVIVRNGILVPLSVPPTSFNFPSMLFQVAPVTYDKASWKDNGMADLFDSALETTSTVIKGALPAKIRNLSWRLTRVAVDGTFAANFSSEETKSMNGWGWMLAGAGKPTFLGVVVEKVSEGLLARSIILELPEEEHDNSSDKPTDKPTEKSTGEPTSNNSDCHCDSSTRKPTEASEVELANNPGVYTEDPGSFCKPFSNPERVLSEHSFYTILRVEAPVISAEASKRLEEPAAVDFDPPEEMLDNINAPADDIDFGDADLGSVGGVRLRSLALAGGRFGPLSEKIPLLSSAGMINKVNKGISVVPGYFPPAFNSIFDQMDRTRKYMNAANPVQWDSHSLRYQATTVAVGHILEFRVRTRSNGYSLGGVAKTLTLAPRQTMRIQKVQWSRTERAQRIESTQYGDQTNDSMTHDTTYQDAVGATLREWAQGSSKSSVTSAAAGVGAVLGPVAIGGGVAHSSSSSSSQQSGGRDSTAHEESQWRDAIRRHGDSVRKFESMVVQEVSQNEEVTGTVEVVRNINYAHSLTIIYHNILRHLRVNTEFAGVRECLFVPFAMKPFTMQRAYRWRDTLKSVLRDRKYTHALTYLKDVLTGFKYSKIPPGRRADQQIRAMYGSVYVNLGIARPLDADDGKFRQDLWAVLTPYLPLSAISIWQQVGQQIEANRDALYQRNFAPSIANKWANVIEMRTENDTLIEADFTLATSYSYNSTVRIDFQVDPRVPLTRAMLSTIKIKAKAGLSAGSVANVRSAKFHYQTDYESQDVFLNQGVGDLVDFNTGAPDLKGAVLSFPLMQYELQNPRADLVFEVVELLEHFNEHVEYYHKMIWWRMDRDRLFMLIDGFMVPRSDPPTSIASVVERDPIAITGNSLIFRVSAGAFVGSAQAKTPQELYNWYDNHGNVSTPMLISLPTDGLYAQTIMDECVALEEHYGSLDWALNDPDPELGSLDPSLLMSRRSDPDHVEPTKLPDTLINLSNGGQAPVPQGLAGVLGAVQNGEAFRDMAGLQGTQGLAQAGLQTAAGLATSFGGTAASLKLAEMAAQKQAVQDADKKLASIQNAKNKGLQTEESAKAHANKVLQDLSGTPSEGPPHEDKAVQDLITAAANVPNSTVAAATKSGAVQVAFGTTDSTIAAATSASTTVGTADPYTNPAYIAAVNAAKKLPKPTWAQWKASYPDYVTYPDSAAYRHDVIGGHIDSDRAPDGGPLYDNTCSIRFSRCWNYTVAPLPRIPGDRSKYRNPFTPLFSATGADGMNYAVRSADVREWLRRVWGKANVDESKPAGAPATGWFDKTKLQGMNGILCFTIEGWTDATGHVDILLETNKYSSEAAPDPHKHPGYWDKAKRIEFWPLVDIGSTAPGLPAPTRGGDADVGTGTGGTRDGGADG